MDIYGFFDAIELLSSKIYKDKDENSENRAMAENIESFITASTEFFEDFVQKQAAEQENTF